MASGESDLGGTGTVVTHVGVNVRGPVKVIVWALGGGIISWAETVGYQNGNSVYKDPGGTDTTWGKYRQLQYTGMLADRSQEFLPR